MCDVIFFCPWMVLLRALLSSLKISAYKLSILNLRHDRSEHVFFKVL